MNKYGRGPGDGPVEFSGGYFQVPDLVFDLPLTANEKLVLIYFMRRADRAGRSFPSVERICRDCGFGSRNTAYKAINNLVNLGLIRRSPVPGRSHNYFVSREFYRVIEDAKSKYAGRVKESSPTCSEYEHPRSDNEQPGVQNMNTKEYTVEGSTEKEYTVKKETHKNIKRTNEEARASSSLSPTLDYYHDNEVTLLDVAEHMHSLTPRERKEFDREAQKPGKPGEPDPADSLWQRRLLRVRYLKQIRDGGQGSSPEPEKAGCTLRYGLLSFINWIFSYTLYNKSKCLMIVVSPSKLHRGGSRMSFGNRIYIFIAAFLILSIYFLALPEKGYSGVGPIIGCCQYINGEGGDQCLNLPGGGDEECPSIIEGEFVGFFEGETCGAETGLCSGFAVNIPTISEWGLIATAGILGLMSIMILRRRRVKA